MRFRIFSDEEEEERELQREERERETGEGQAEAGPARFPIVFTVLLWAVALAPRLVTLFFLTDPENAGAGWHGDVYHHWQIAYLTKEIGLWAPGGPRLWDLKGLDYFWGILHPIILLILFYVTGSTDVILARLLTSVFGALVVVLIFHLCRRHWGTPVAAAAAGFAALAPTSVFVDSTGFLEPLGVGLCLLGIWLWPKRGLWSGIAFALAAMARAEAWIFSLGMVVAAFLRRQALQQRLPLVIAWASGILLYMKILIDHTNNPIYPVWANFLANALGQWEFRQTLSPEQVAIRPWLTALMVAGLIGLGLVLWKRPPSYMFLTFGFGYLVFTGGVLGTSAYLKSWESWFWMERFFVFPYEFAAMLAALALFVVLPRYLGKHFVLVAASITVIALIAVQAEWPPILARYATTRSTWEQAIEGGRSIGVAYHQPEYEGGVLNIPPGNADLVYVLSRYDHVEGRHIVGQLYDPFYPDYAKPGFTYMKDPQDAGVLLSCWLDKSAPWQKDPRTRLFAVDSGSENYHLFIQDHPEWFTSKGGVAGYGWELWDVHVPPPTPKECDDAGKAARR